MSLSKGLELRFHPNETLFPWWYDDRQGAVVSHPCFIATGVFHSTDAVEFDCEQYQFYFRENLAIGLFGISSKSKSLGYHKHDVEGIHVLFDKQSHEPQWVYFKAHGPGQGIWKRWRECEKNGSGALVVYIAWGSHATYPSRGTVPRILGLANDCVSCNGKRILITPESFFPAKRVEFLPGVVLYDKIQPVSNFSSTTKDRVLLPFVEKNLRKQAKK